MTFTEWLKGQLDRDDPIGDFARDVGEDPGWPQDGKLLDFELYLYRLGAESLADPLRAAWREYEGALHGRA